MFEAVIRILSWVIALVPLAVFGIVSRTIAERGFAPFKSLGAFIVAVLLGLTLQACYYLTRVKLGSWVKPLNFLRGGADAFLTAFSTDSSTAAMPVTFRVLQEKIGLRESSASLGALVGTNFNNDGTALYEAMSALFISQVLGATSEFGTAVSCHHHLDFCVSRCSRYPGGGVGDDDTRVHFRRFTHTVHCFIDHCRLVSRSLPHCN